MFGQTNRWIPPNGARSRVSWFLVDTNPLDLDTVCVDHGWVLRVVQLLLWPHLKPWNWRFNALIGVCNTGHVNFVILLSNPSEQEQNWYIQYEIIYVYIYIYLHPAESFGLALAPCWSIEVNRSQLWKVTSSGKTMFSQKALISHVGCGFWH